MNRETEEIEIEKAMLVEALKEMIGQHCEEISKNVYFSDALSANAKAMQVLVDLGEAKQVGGRYGRVISIECDAFNLKNT
jgi:hypothetical protein